jgi:hypothetical protein
VRLFSSGSTSADDEGGHHGDQPRTQARGHRCGGCQLFPGPPGMTVAAGKADFVGAKELGPLPPTFASTAFGTGTLAGAGASFAAQPATRPIATIEKAPADRAIRRAVLEVCMKRANTIFRSKNSVNQGSQRSPFDDHEPGLCPSPLPKSLISVICGTQFTRSHSQLKNCGTYREGQRVSGRHLTHDLRRLSS